MPYRILLRNAPQVLSGKRRDKPHGGNQSITAQTDRAEVRSCKGLLLFYRPRPLALKL
jgi:hypothetical protein